MLRETLTKLLRNNKVLMQAYTQKWNLKMKSEFQIITKSTQIPLSQEIQIYDPLLMGIHFSWQ
jgi:hypothetical protein